MQTTTTAPRDAEPLWFLAGRLYIRVPATSGDDGMSVIEQWAPRGDSPPLHVHRTEDELFHVLDGELTVSVDGKEERRLRAGDLALAPKGVPHTYRVDSELAHWCVTTTRGDFERFVRELSRPPQGDGLPPRLEPTPELVEQIALAGARHGIELVGPPLA